MKVVRDGVHNRIFSNDLTVADTLLPAAYEISFSNMSGWSLIRKDDFNVVESKIYGNHEKLLHKVMSSYDIYTRSLGIILSGDKGIGKSLFATMLCKDAINKGMPVIIVDRYYNGLGSFLDSIQQECVVLFDEFDKTYSSRSSNGDKHTDAQDDLLTLFDGVSVNKKMYIITCNNIYSLSQYFISRPGRFHYHIRFDYPSKNEIELYLKDNVKEEYWGEIDNVIAFSTIRQLNYDCLRAITFELNCGEKFNDVIRILNILTTDGSKYVAHLITKSGERNIVNHIHTRDIQGSFSEYVHLKNTRDSFRLEFDLADAKYDKTLQCRVVKDGKFTVDRFTIENDEDDDKDNFNDEANYRKDPIERIELHIPEISDIHYSMDRFF